LPLFPPQEFFDRPGFFHGHIHSGSLAHRGAGPHLLFVGK
jgi:hypothetical protein